MEAKMMKEKQTEKDEEKKKKKKKKEQYIWKQEVDEIVGREHSFCWLCSVLTLFSVNPT
jgi:hypothetical protein